MERSVKARSIKQPGTATTPTAASGDKKRRTCDWRKTRVSKLAAGLLATTRGGGIPFKNILFLYAEKQLR